VVPQQQKRPRSSLIRFEAELPNECWQADATAWQLADGEVVEVLNLIDDHSGLFLGADASRTSSSCCWNPTSLLSTRPKCSAET
jgi:transposase InsO family protein